MDAGDNGNGDHEAGNGDSSDNGSPSDIGGGNVWVSDPSAPGVETTVSEHSIDGNSESVRVTASPDSSDSNEVGSDGMSPSDFGSGNPSSDGENGANNNSVGDINIPSSLNSNSNGEGNRDQTLSMFDALVMTAETVIGTVEEGHKVAKVNMPNGLQTVVKNVKLGANAYNLASYGIKYGNAIKSSDYRTATSESINALFGIGVSAVPVVGLPLGIVAHAIMEQYDIGGQIYDGINSLDIGVTIHDLIHDENP